MRIKQLLLSIHKTFIRIPSWSFIFIMVLSKYILLIMLMPLFIFMPYQGEIRGPSIIYESPVFAIVLSVLIAPIFETFLFQKSILRLTRKIGYMKERIWLQIFISAFVFGLFHWYSLIYILQGVLLGLVFAYSYTVFEHKNSSPIWNVVCIHGIGNLISMIIYYLDSGII